MAQFGAIITMIGLAKITNAQITNTTLGIESMVLGDGNGAYYTVSQNQTALRREVWRGQLADQRVDSKNSNRIEFSAFIPSTTGGFTIREVGLLDTDGNLIAVSLYPEQYKPTLNQGISDDLLINFVIETANADVITLAVDATNVLATRQYVDKNITDLESEVTKHLAHVEKGRVSGNDDKKYKIISGAVRNSGDGWTFIVDSAHDSTGLSDIVFGNSLQLNYGYTAKKVSSLLVTPDETFSSYGLQVGGSVGLDKTVLDIYMPFNVDVAKNNIINHDFLRNVVTKSDLPDGSGFKVTHPATVVGDVPVVSQVTSTTGEQLDCRITYTQNDVTVMAYSDMCGHISYNGTTWVASTENINKPTLAFDNATGELTITHVESVHNQLVAQVTGRGVLTPVISSATSTAIKVKFIDYNNDVVLTPSNDMRFFYSRPAKVKTRMPSDFRVTIRRGNVKVPARDVISSVGNFWINGVMEVD